ncbi:MAG: hypothetical protein AAFO69_03130, partial [Bacteroidota bacterium]
IGQAATVIFLATGAIVKNKRIDTHEVFFVRPMSNLDYVMGKAFAIFKLFFWLNVGLLTIGLIFNLTNPLAAFNWQAYVLYPLIISMPTVIFATGASFFLATILRNQPVSIILLVGLTAVLLIYFFGKYEHAFDYMAFGLQALASEIAGFSDLKSILWQRGFYVLTGIAFLFATAVFFGRLNNHRRNQYLGGLFALVFFSLAAYQMFNLWSHRSDRITLRNEMININGQWAEKPNISIVSSHLTVDHQQNTIDCKAQLRVKNQSTTDLDTIFFTLNPGLKVSQLLVEGKAVSHDRQQHIISLSLAEPIAPQQQLDLDILYAGTVIEDVAHLEVSEERIEERKSRFVYAIDKRYAFLQPEFVLLTKDVLWYPDVQVGYSKKAPLKSGNFVDFKLDARVSGSHVAVSQGKSTLTENGTYQFRPESSLPQLSLAIGQYQKKAITVDSVEYAIYHMPGMDYFTSYFDQVGDTLGSLITDLQNAYQQERKLSYPFKRLQIVEVPIQFHAYDKIYTTHQSYVQPETIYMPEKGAITSNLDFKRQFKQMDNQARSNNQVMSDKEKQANVFSDMVKKVFTKQLSNNWFFDGRDSDEPNFSIFANYFHYNTGIASEDWPILNRNLTGYLTQEVKSKNDFSRNLNGVSFAEECNQLMSQSNIMEILTQEEQFSKILKSISLKGEYLFSYLSQLIGEEQFRAFLLDQIAKSQHQLMSYQSLRKDMITQFDLDIDPIIKQIYFDTDQPSYLIDNLQRYEFLDGDRKRYQIIFDVHNTGSNDGVIKIKFNARDVVNELGFIQRSEEAPEIDFPERLAVVKAGEIKQIGFVLDGRPKQISINTLVSKNIPSVILINTGKFDLKKGMKPFDGTRIVNNQEEKLQYEVIVDNEDPGFSTFSPIKDTYLKTYLDERNPTDKKYHGVWRRSYSKWLVTTGSNFHGQHVRSAHFTRSGKGEKSTTWSPELKEEGFYDLYVYLMGKNQNQVTSQNGGNTKFTYQYIINHGDGTDNITFDLGNAERGWNYLGSYYFSTEGGNVVLTDECDLRTVFADAIKWVKQ